MDTHGEIQPEEMEEGSQQSERSAVTSTPSTPGDDRYASSMSDTHVRTSDIHGRGPSRYILPDDYNRTPLHMAAWAVNVDRVRFILEMLQGRSVEDAQAVVNAQDRFGFTPLHLAVRGILPEEEEGSLQKYRDRKEVVRILTTSSWMLPDRYITAASERDETDLKCGRYTPLHMAAREGSVGIVEFLLRQPLCRGDFKGCDPINLRATTWEGHTPLAIAYNYRHFDVAELLESSDLSWQESERAKLASSLNAIMVGATLIAAATFGAWRLPPLGTSEMEMPNPASDEVARKFKWRSRASSACFAYIWHAFLFSVVALLLSILTTIPTPDLITEVKRLRKTVICASCLLYMALFCFSCASQLFWVLVLDTTSAHNHGPHLLSIWKLSIIGGLVIISALMLCPIGWLWDEVEARYEYVDCYKVIGTILVVAALIVQGFNVDLIHKIFNLYKGHK